jgi:hypothetical protein
VIAGACGEDGGDAACRATAEIGTGTLEFEALLPEADLEVVVGPQGGHHFILHARMTGLDPGQPALPGDASNPRTAFTTFRGEERVSLDQPPYRLGYEESAGGELALPGGRIVPFDEAFVAELDGARLDVTVEITDVDGDCATDRRTVIAHAGPTPDA